MSVREEIELNQYIGLLQLSLVQLWEGDDELIWNAVPCARYTPKGGYIYLSLVGNDQRMVWWWKKIWKFHCLPKSRLFWWCVLENKVPIWENLHKQGIIDPRWCALCRAGGERLYICSLNAHTMWRSRQSVVSYWGWVQVVGGKGLQYLMHG